MKISPVLNDKLIRKQRFWYLDQFWPIGIDEGTWFLKFTIILDKTEDQKVKKYEKLDQNSCLVLLFHTICLLDSQEYVMWVFQKDHAAAKIPCNWALLYSIFFARKPTWSLIKISVSCWTECGPVSCFFYYLIFLFILNNCRL